MTTTFAETVVLMYFVLDFLKYLGSQSLIRFIKEQFKSLSQITVSGNCDYRTVYLTCPVVLRCNAFRCNGCVI